ncbi:MAG: hypothetical protein HQ582_31170, partial [Planctomycetes bacterium]|nr:hypothetical protein [Planctomycetota bacterium]
MRSKPSWSSGAITGGLFLLAIEFVGFAVAAAPTQAPLFVIGTPDAHAAEFGLARPGEGYLAFSTRFGGEVVYTVGRSKPQEWPYIHPAVRD